MGFAKRISPVGMIFMRPSLSPTPWHLMVGFIAVKQTTGTLQTSIERTSLDWKMDLKDALKIEFQTIREFQRRTLDPLYKRVHSDTLFCLALMQHYGAPTRLLDCSYSPFAAVAFAMEKGPKRLNSSKDKEVVPVVWCFSVKWLRDKTIENTKHKDAFGMRSKDDERNNPTFHTLYNLGSEAKGVFLCPADLTSSFVDNLRSMNGWESDKNVVKLRLEMDRDKATEFVRNLKGMNLSFAALFPGLEGFARSIGQQLFHYRELAEVRAGLSDYLSGIPSSHNS
jgi:FRG domain